MKHRARASFGPNAGIRIPPGLLTARLTVGLALNCAVRRRSDGRNRSRAILASVTHATPLRVEGSVSCGARLAIAAGFALAQVVRPRLNAVVVTLPGQVPFLNGLSTLAALMALDEVARA